MGVMAPKHSFLVICLCAAPAQADMISDEGMAPYEVCALCHGLDGLSAVAKFPRLAGQKSDYILKQIGDFHDGARVNDGGQMRDIVTELAPEDRQAVADWFAAQPAPSPADVADTAQGAALFATLGCGSCHGPTPPEGLTVPHVAAQHETYLSKQLTDFRDGRRDNDPDGVMRARAAGLTDADIVALAAYLAATPRE